MTPEKAALIILSLGLITVLIWWVFKPRKGGPDVGLAVFHEDETKDTGPCPGPLVWFDVPEGGAVLECHTCGYVMTTGNFMDEQHSATPLMREGMAS